MTSEVERQRAAKDSRSAQRVQLLLWMLEEWMWKEDGQGMLITHLTIRSGYDRGGEVLVIVKARFDNAPFVAFNGGSTPEAALKGALERIRNADMKWKEDTPFVPGA